MSSPPGKGTNEESKSRRFQKCEMCLWQLQIN